MQYDDGLGAKSYGERLKVLYILSVKKRRLKGALTIVFQYYHKEGGVDLISVVSAVGQETVGGIL